MAIPKHNGRSETLNSLVSRTYDDNGRDQAKTIDALVAAFRRRPSLHEEIYRIAATTLFSSQVARDRAVVMSGGDIGSAYAADNDAPVSRMPHKDMPSYQSPAALKAIAANARSFAQKLTGLYLTPFRHEGRVVILGNATPEELRPIAGHYRTQGATMIRTSRWLDKVIAGAKDGKPIHKSLTLKELERMQHDANSTDVA